VCAISTDLCENHSRDFLWRKRLDLSEVIDFHHWISALVDDLERPGLDILLDGFVVESSPDEAPAKKRSVSNFFDTLQRTNLMSKTVLAGFIAAWFFAASPINRSSGVKETKEGVVKLPCSLATEFYQNLEH
jgi:hypothetical protein